MAVNLKPWKMMRYSKQLGSSPILQLTNQMANWFRSRILQRILNNPCLKKEKNPWRIPVGHEGQIEKDPIDRWCSNLCVDETWLEVMIPILCIGLDRIKEGSAKDLSEFPCRCAPVEGLKFQRNIISRHAGNLSLEIIHLPSEESAGRIRQIASDSLRSKTARIAGSL